jgi:hypothetical protein
MAMGRVPMLALATAAAAWLAIVTPAGAASLDALKPGTEVRLRTAPPARERVDGIVLRRDPDRLVLRLPGPMISDDTEREVRLDAIERLEMSTGRRTALGGFIGLAVGAGLGLIIGRNAETDGLVRISLEGPIVVGCSLIGMAAGLVAGSQVRRWERVPLPVTVGLHADEMDVIPVAQVTFRW